MAGSHTQTTIGEATIKRSATASVVNPQPHALAQGQHALKGDRPGLAASREATSRDAPDQEGHAVSYQ